MGNLHSSANTMMRIKRNWLTTTNKTQTYEEFDLDDYDEVDWLDIEEMVNDVGMVFDDNITAGIVSRSDGEYNELWVTRDHGTDSPDAVYERIYPEGDF